MIQQNDTWYTIKSWTFSSAIDTISDRWNKLKIEKEGVLLQITINDSLHGSFSAESIGAVNLVGLYVQGDLHIHFDDVKAERK